MSIGGQTAGGGQRAKGGFDAADPFDIVPVTGRGNTARKIFHDPLYDFRGDDMNDRLGIKMPEKQETEEERQRREEAAKAALRASVDNMYGIGVGGEDAAVRMKEEEDALANANREYYTDDLGRNYAKAERNTRFNLARQGLLGGSEDSDRHLELKSDRDLGATRLDDTVRAAVNALKTQREQERLRAIGLINAGEGENAVRAASLGLENSLANAKTANKVNLFGDLFAGTADAAAAQNANAANAALLARYKQQLATYFPADSSSGGRVTPT